MLNCREASKLASDSLDRPLPLGKRVAVRVHLLMCRFCRRYLEQIRWIRETIRCSDEETRTLPEETELRLTGEAKERIRSRLRDR